MIKAIWERNTPYSKFLISVGIILVSAVFFTLLSTILSTLIYGVSFLELQQLMSEPEQPVTMSILKLVQTLSAIGTFIIPPFILAYLFSKRPINFLSLDKSPGNISLVLIIIIMIVSTPMINFMGEINSNMHLPGFLKGVEDWMRDAEDQAARLTEAFLEMKTTGDLFFNLFMIALLPAVGEELVFRGVIQKIFHQWSKNVHVAVWTSAILFSAMHVQFYGFLPRMVLGGMLGYMLVWSGSLWLPIVAHFINNAAAIVFTYLFQHELSEINPDKIGTESDFISVAVSVIITTGLFVLLYRKNKTEVNSEIRSMEGG
jgi:membrane protease YdiL (CAAX protease family)